MKTRDKTKELLVEKYLESLKQNEIPWSKGWRTLGRNRNGISNRPYSKKNSLLLALISDIKGYTDRRWYTFAQIKKLREEKGITGPMFTRDSKGEGFPITGYGIYSAELSKMLTFKEYKEFCDNGLIDKNKCYVKPWTTNYVFNGDLVAGLEKEPVEVEGDPIDFNSHIKTLIQNMGVKYEEHGDSAYYHPKTDTVVLPPASHFKTPEDYYSTQLHELSHASGHQTRLNRETIVNHHPFGSEEYAREELNAEIASSFLCADLSLGISEEHIQNHAAYIQSWISILEKDPEVLFSAINIATGIEEYMLEKADIELDKDFDYDAEPIDETPMKGLDHELGLRP